MADSTQDDSGRAECDAASSQERKTLVEFIYAVEHNPFVLKVEPSGSKKKKLLEPKSVVVRICCV